MTNFLADCHPLETLPSELRSWLEEVRAGGLVPLAWHRDWSEPSRVKLDCQPLNEGWVIPCSDGVVFAVKPTGGGVVRQECGTVADALAWVRA